MDGLNVLYEKIGSDLFLLLPENASSISYFAQIYSDYYTEYMIYYIKDDIEYNLDFTNNINVGNNILSLLKQVQKNILFKSEQWTQCQFNLTSDGEFSIKFAYIDEEDSYGGLYLRGISDLDKDELDEFNVPEELWLEMKKKYGK